jgi:hypothetical protein
MYFLLYVFPLAAQYCGELSKLLLGFSWLTVSCEKYHFCTEDLVGKVGIHPGSGALMKVIPVLFAHTVVMLLSGRSSEIPEGTMLHSFPVHLSIFSSGSPVINQWDFYLIRANQNQYDSTL